jgi:hypothetical protein
MKIAPDENAALQWEYDYLQDLKPALRCDPRAAYAFAAMMWRIGEMAKSNPEMYALISSLVDDGIRLGYEYTTDHQTDHEAGLERFKRDLADQ